MSKFMFRHPGLREALHASSITPTQLDEVRTKVLETYYALAEPLKEASKWKRGKPEHARKSAEEAREFADFLGLNELEVAFFALAFCSHDLGRMIQALLQASAHDAAENIRISLTGKFRDAWSWVLEDAERSMPYRDEYHGTESANLLRPILGIFAESNAGQWLLAAITYHSHRSNPTLDMVGGVEEAHAVCCIVRDLDKLVGFREARDYTGNTERKRKERIQNWPKQVQDDPDWGTELGKIDPYEFLFDTPFEQPIDRQKCRSFEAYMLQFLKWLPGFASSEMQALALREGGPQIVAAYLMNQLADTPAQSKHLLAMLESWNAGALLHSPQAT